MRTKRTAPESLIRLTAATYRSLLWIFPPAFRRQYEEEMSHLFQVYLLDTYRRAGFWRSIGWCWTAWWDLFPSAGNEWWMWLMALEFNSSEVKMTTHQLGDGHAFGTQLIQALEAEPTLYPLIVSIDPSRELNEVAESIVLDADPDEPEVALTLFRDLAGASLPDNVAKWLQKLRQEAQSYYSHLPVDEAQTLEERFLFGIYADPKLFDQVAAEEVGHGLYTIVESLALTAEPDEIESVLTLMRDLEM